MASLSRRPLDVSFDAPPTKRRKTEKEVLLKPNDNILRKFEDWFHKKHETINIRHLFMGEVCTGRDELKKGDTVIVCVIESKETIENEEFQCDGKIFTVVYKLWGEITVSEEEKKSKKQDHDKVKEINKYLKQNADSFFEKHSNLEIIRASLYRLKSNKAKKVKTISEPCIAIYCSYKGVVPVGEELFPKEIDGFPTDIREGFFYLHSNFDICANSKDQLDPLRMGACISRESDADAQGTLGGFVQLNNGGIGFITCAHVLHNTDELLRNVSNLSSPIVQPSVCCEGSQRCGNIFKSVFPSSTVVDGVTVDATVVEITHRTPDKALFADLTTARLKTLGFSRSMLPKFCCGKIRSERKSQNHPTDKVLKSGMMSGLTLGEIKEMNSFSRYRDIYLGDKQRGIIFKYKSQLIIHGVENKPFSVIGDSGALVFQFTDVNELECIGMIVGAGGDEGFSYATPITSVLEALSVTLKDF